VGTVALIHEWNLGADFYRTYKVEYMNRTETEEAIEEFKGHVAKLEARVKIHEQQTKGEYEGQFKEARDDLQTAKKMLRSLQGHLAKLDELGVDVIPQPDPRGHMPDYQRAFYENLEWEEATNSWLWDGEYVDFRWDAERNASRKA
jgi:hypothetical protein